MAAFLHLVLLAGTVSGTYIRYPRATADAPAGAGGSMAGTGGSMAGAGAGAFSSASSSSFSSSSGTKVAPGPGGYGNVNAFTGMSNFGPPPFGGDTQSPYRGGAGAATSSQPGQSSFSGYQGAGGFSGSQGGGFSGSQAGGFSGSQGAGFPGSQGAGFPGFPGYSPFVPQYGQQYPWVPFPNFAAPFDFMTFLNQYFQALQNFQAQAEAQAQQAASSGGGLPIDTNEVGGVGGLAVATYGPQGGYGNANIFPKPEGGLETRFGGGDDETPQNSIGGGPVSSVSGSFKPPGGSGFGVFTSSSSGSSDVNGKKTSFKQSSIGVNDNGKVTTYTAHDP